MFFSKSHALFSPLRSVVQGPRRRGGAVFRKRARIVAPVALLATAVVLGVLSVLDQPGLVSGLELAALGASGVLALLFYLWHTAELRRREYKQLRALQAGSDLLATEATHHAAQLKELAYHLQMVREEERSRLARDLHDEVGALLISAKLDVARIKSRLGNQSPELLERLAHLIQMLDGGIALKRRIIEDLRPSALDQLGLQATLDILVHEFTKQSSVHVRSVLSPVRLAPAAQLTVFRIVQEAMTNIAKYAHARQVWIHLGEHRGRVVVSVRDDGVGFDLSTRGAGSYGLMGMRFRVEAEGGALHLQSAPGHGTLVRADLPIGSGAPVQSACV